VAGPLTRPPLVCLHGFMDTSRTWELVRPALERRFEVLAPTLPGHAGGPPLPAALGDATMADAVERDMDDAGIGDAVLVGNSLGGFVALQLAARGRARSVVAFAPAGGWARGDESWRELLALQASMRAAAKAAAPHAEAILATSEGRRRATRYITVRHEHIPAELLAHQLMGVATCEAAARLDEYATRSITDRPPASPAVPGWELDAAAIACPVRIVWGTEDRLLPWPAAAARLRSDWLPHADWVELDGVGHCPQLDVPLEAAQLILGF
jgi:pimeloyl-ACP methyl ester carboxylesterase